jgi:8-amino-7-oxononanoate synthase
MSEIEERLAELERQGLDRRLRMISGPQGPTVLLDGNPVLLLCSNNYLGLADHPRVREAAAEAAMRWGVGAGASRLVSGTMTIHRRLEERLAEFEGSESCVLFGSGYLANIGVIGALAAAGDTVFSDELNHASIVDGCRLSRAQVVVYRHLDMEHLEWSLRRHGGRRDGRGGRLIVTDSVFSMDGDVAPLGEIVELAQSWGARVAVDEAHATGTLGPDGRGAIAQAGLAGEIDVVVGTLGKALGSYGAYVCAEAEMIRYLINTSRSLIFSTAPSPPAVAGALAALELLTERPHRVERLRSNARVLRRALALEGFAVTEDDMHIVPLVVGDERVAMQLCQEAIEQGVFAQAIRPPTVPPGTSRLRLAAMASHTASDMRMAASVLGDAARRLGLDPATIGSPRIEHEHTDEDDGRREHPYEEDGRQERPSEYRQPGPVVYDEAGEARVMAVAADRTGGVPFDLEPINGAPFDVEPASGAPFDVEPAGGVPFDVERSGGAPFDIERESSGARVASPRAA